jgi:beta-glucoside operon transcriptional antiterminator
MKIVQVFNNNVVSAVDADGKELILMGRGIGFGKKAGQTLDENSVVKKYSLLTPEVQHKFAERVDELPEKIIRIASKALAYSREITGKEINEILFITLADHLMNVLAHKDDQEQPVNLLLWDIKRFFPDEFKVGMKVVNQMEAEYDIQLNEDEAGFIALHIVNAENDNRSDAIEVTKLIQVMEHYLRTIYQKDIDVTTLNYHRFITHLKLFALEIIQNQETGPSTKAPIPLVEKELIALVKEKYPRSFETVNLIGQHLQSEYSYAISVDEQLYLAIHIAKIINENGR